MLAVLLALLAAAVVLVSAGALTLDTLGRPLRLGFRLLRGPVPHVVEELVLDEASGTTTLAYRGQLGSDVWWPGPLWGRVVARRWERAEAASLAQIAAVAEERSGRRAERVPEP